MEAPCLGKGIGGQEVDRRILGGQSKLDDADCSARRSQCLGEVGREDLAQKPGVPREWGQQPDLAVRVTVSK